MKQPSRLFLFHFYFIFIYDRLSDTEHVLLNKNSALNGLADALRIVFNEDLKVQDYSKYYKVLHHIALMNPVVIRCPTNRITILNSHLNFSSWKDQFAEESGHYRMFTIREIYFYPFQ